MAHIDRADGNNPIRLHFIIGARAPARATASGLVLLVFQDSSSREELPRDRRQPFTERTIIPPSRLPRPLEEIRRDGYAFSASAPVPGQSHTGERAAALSVVGPSGRTAVRVSKLAGVFKKAPRQDLSVVGHATAKRAAPERKRREGPGKQDPRGRDHTRRNR